LSLVLKSRGHKGLAAGAAFVGAAGNALGLVGWRRPERALAVTAREALPGLGAGVLVGLLMLLAFKRE